MQRISSDTEKAIERGSGSPAPGFPVGYQKQALESKEPVPDRSTNMLIWGK
jgi:hypothetical protein